MKKVSLNDLLLLLAGVIFLSYIILVGSNQKNGESSGVQPVVSLPRISKQKIIPIVIGNKTLNAFVADTPALSELGLGGRESIGADQAMLFDFGRPDFYGIWMKDMKFPIDIFWLDEFKRVIYLKEDISPETYPEVFIPNSKAVYVIEVGAGFAEKNRIKIGDEVYFSETR